MSHGQRPLISEAIRLIPACAFPRLNMMLQAQGTIFPFCLCCLVGPWSKVANCQSCAITSRSDILVPATSSVTITKQQKSQPKPGGKYKSNKKYYKETRNMHAKLQSETQKFSLESIKDRARQAAEKAENQRNTKIVGYTTVIVNYDGSKTVSNRDKKRYKHLV